MMTRILLATLAVLLLAGAAFADVKENDQPTPGVLVDDPGPDMFGYTRVDPPAGWTLQDISGTGTLIVTGDDNSEDYALAAPFSFYGTDYAVTTPSTNGGVTFDGVYMNLSNVCPLPDQNGIFVFNDDLVVEGGVYGQYFEICPLDGGAGEEPCTIIMWDETRHFGSSPAGFWDMELVLFHTTRNIGMLFDGNFVQDAGGTTGIDQGINDVNYALTVACNTADAPVAGGQYMILHPDVVSVERTSFSAVKALYR